MSTIESHLPLNRGLSRKSLEIAAWLGLPRVLEYYSSILE